VKSPKYFDDRMMEISIHKPSKIIYRWYTITFTTFTAKLYLAAFPISMSSISTLEDIPMTHHAPGIIVDYHYKLMAWLIWLSRLSRPLLTGKSPVFITSLNGDIESTRISDQIFMFDATTLKCGQRNNKRTYHLGVVHPTHLCFMVCPWRWVRIIGFTTLDSEW